MAIAPPLTSISETIFSQLTSAAATVLLASGTPTTIFREVFRAPGTPKVDLEATASKLEEMTQTIFDVVRHGQTGSNLLGTAIQGHRNDSTAQLTPQGRDEAEAQGSNLAKIRHYEIIITSDLDRAVETAAIVAAKFPGATVIIDPRFREINHALHDGMPPSERYAFCEKVYAERAQEHPDRAKNPYFYWEFNPLLLRKIPADATLYSAQMLPSGAEGIFEEGPETVLHLFQRATKAMQGYAGQFPGKRILIITHGAVMTTLATPSDHQDASQPYPVFFQKGIPRNCDVMTFTLGPDGTPVKKAS
jgi:broad specificity phosphatase PhoE